MEWAVAGPGLFGLGITLFGVEMLMPTKKPRGGELTVEQ